MSSHLLVCSAALHEAALERAEVVDQAPDVGARVASLRRAITVVLCVERLGPLPRLLVLRVQTCGRGIGEVLLATKEGGRSSLRGMPVDEGGLVLEVKDEPQFDARVGDDDLDAVRGGQGEGTRDVRVLIHVERAPDVAVRTATTASRLAFRGTLGLNGTLDQCEWCTAAGVHRDQNVVAQLASQRQEVSVLRLLALNEDEDLWTSGLLAPSTWRTRPSPRTHRLVDVMRSAAAANCCAERIGVAPYRPAR